MIEELEESVELPINMTPHEDIAACTNALAAIGDWDEVLMDEEEQMILREIKSMALYIIHIGIREIYTSNFYGKETETSEGGAS